MVSGRLARWGGVDGLKRQRVESLRHLAASLLTLRGAAEEALFGLESHSDVGREPAIAVVPEAVLDRLRTQAADVQAWLAAVYAAIDEQVAAAIQAARPKPLPPSAVTATAMEGCVAAASTRAELQPARAVSTAAVAASGATVDVEAYAAAVAAARPRIVPAQQQRSGVASAEPAAAATPASERSSLLAGATRADSGDGTDSVEGAAAVERARSVDIAGSLADLAAALKVQALALNDRLRADVAILDTTAAVVEGNLTAAGRLNDAMSGPGGPAANAGWGAAMGAFCEGVALVLAAGVVWAGTYVVIRVV